MRSEQQSHQGNTAERFCNSSPAASPFVPARVMLVPLLIFLAASGTALCGEVTTITLKESVELAGPNVLLTQAAEIEPPDDTIAGVDLGPVPWPGSKRLVDAAVVKIALYREGFDLNKIKIQGRGCVVTTRTVTIPGDEIAEAARKLLVERLPWDEENVAIEIEQTPEDKKVAAGGGTPLLSASMVGRTNPSGRVNVVVTGVIDETPVFKTTVAFHVHVFETIAVAERDIARGEKFSDGNTTLRRMEVSSLAPGSVFTETAQLAGMKAARVIRAGMPVTRHVVIVPPVVRRGAVVTIVFRTDSIKLTARGIAREDGAPGDIIRVKNVDSGREISAEVQPDGSVSVSF